jgi:hypothetical protein
MKKVARLTLLAALIAALPASIKASDRVSMHVSPQMAFAPVDLNVRATVEADPDNRSIQVVADSSEFYRSSEIQLDGEHAPRTTIVSFRGVPSGHYDVRVVVKGSRGEARATTHMVVDVLSTQ